MQSYNIVSHLFRPIIIHLCVPCSTRHQLSLFPTAVVVDDDDDVWNGIVWPIHTHTKQERAAYIVSDLDQLFHWTRFVEPYAGTFIVIIAILGQRIYPMFTDRRPTAHRHTQHRLCPNRCPLAINFVGINLLSTTAHQMSAASSLLDSLFG